MMLFLKDFNTHQNHLLTRRGIVADEFRLSNLFRVVDDASRIERVLPALCESLREFTWTDPLSNRTRQVRFQQKGILTTPIDSLVDFAKILIDIPDESPEEYDYADQCRVHTNLLRQKLFDHFFDRLTLLTTKRIFWSVPRSMEPETENFQFAYTTLRGFERHMNPFRLLAASLANDYCDCLVNHHVRGARFFENGIRFPVPAINEIPFEGIIGDLRAFLYVMTLFTLDHYQYKKKFKQSVLGYPDPYLYSNLYHYMNGMACATGHELEGLWNIGALSDTMIQAVIDQTLGSMDQMIVKVNPSAGPLLSQLGCAPTPVSEHLGWTRMIKKSLALRIRQLLSFYGAGVQYLN